jgi:hypothetical protein
VLNPSMQDSNSNLLVALHIIGISLVPKCNRQYQHFAQI